MKIVKKVNTEPSLVESFTEFTKSKNIDRPTTIKIIQEVFLSIIKKKYGYDDNFDVIVNVDKGDLQIWQIRTIVDDEFAEDSFDFDPNKHISLTDAKKVESDFEIDEEMSELIPLESFGRRAVMIAKQSLFQKIKEVESQHLCDRYEDMIGEIIVGEVLGFEHKNIIVSDGLGKELILPKFEQIQGDYYKKGDTIKALIHRIEIVKGKPVITLSRTNSLFLTRLLELEIPEIYDGLIGVKAVVREPGEKAKVVVESFDDRIDPVGCCVGTKGNRINAIVKELRGEQIDVINHTENHDLYIHRVISPAKLSSITETSTKILIQLKSDQVALAIGKRGVNIKLASKLLNKNVEIFRDQDQLDSEDVDLSQFIDEIDDWVIAEFRKIGLDTAKQVLALDREDLIKRTDLEEETIDDVLDILASEFDE